MATEEIKIQKVNQNKRNIPPVEPTLCAPSVFLHVDTFKPSAAEECKIQIANEKTRNIAPLNKQLSNDFYCPFKIYNQYKEYKT